jgi:hypothetical protein
LICDAGGSIQLSDAASEALTIGARLPAQG